MNYIKNLRCEIQLYIDNVIANGGWISVSAILDQKHREVTYFEELNKIADPLAKAKEIKEMISICNKYTKVNTCRRLQQILTVKQYELSKLI